MVFGLIAAVLSASACGGGGDNDSTSPPSPATATAHAGTATVPPSAAPAAAGRLVSFRATDGTRLQGRIYGAGPVGVVLTHQLRSDLTEWSDWAPALAARGYRVLAIDVRGTCPGGAGGCSKGAFNPLELARDVAGAAGFLRSRGARSLVLMGGSMGGEASIVAAADAPADVRARVRAVVTLSASEGFAGPIDPAETKRLVARITAPKLFVAGSADQEAARAAREYETFASPPRQALIVDSAAHGASLLSSPEAGAKVTGAITAFLARVAPA